jgi:Ser/Thr protein kinase RdoA (MazF antagonist)
VLHLDLHPGNIMLTSRGPVVIDWSNVASGPAGADVAMAYLIMASSEVDDLPVLVRPAVSTVRASVIRHFLLGARDDPAPHLARVARVRMADRNVRPAERDWLLRKAEEVEQAPQSG